MPEAFGEIKVDGLANLQRALDELPRNMAKRILGSALRAGGQVLAKQVKANIHNRTGRLVKSVTVRGRRVNGHAAIAVRAGNKEAYYAHIVEGGAAQHKITAKKKGRMLFFGGRYYKEIKHPGMRGQGYVRKAFDAKANDAVNAFKKSIAAQISKAWNGAASKGQL